MKITTNRKGYDTIDIEFGETLSILMHISKSKTVEVFLGWQGSPNSGMVNILPSGTLYHDERGRLLVSAEDVCPDEMTIQMNDYPPLKLKKLKLGNFNKKELELKKDLELLLYPDGVFIWYDHDRTICPLCKNDIEMKNSER